MKSALSNEQVTIKLTQLDYFARPNFKVGKEMEIDFLGKKKYNIILKTESKTHGAIVTLRPLSKIKSIRKLQNKTIKMKEETGYNEWKEMIDKMNQSPLIMEQSGCDFRWKIIQIVSGTKKHDSVDDIITEANKLIDWINSEH